MAPLLTILPSTVINFPGLTVNTPELPISHSQLLKLGLKVVL